VEELIQKAEETIVLRPRKFKQRHIRTRIKNALFMHPPEELLQFAMDNGVRTFPKDHEGAKEEALPGIMVADLIIMKHIMKAIKGDERSARLLFSFGFGNPETTLNINDGEEDDELEIPMSIEEKLEFVRKYNGSVSDGNYREAISQAD
jgi:hypothetical protein